MDEKNAEKQTPEKSQRGSDRSLKKKIKFLEEEKKQLFPNKKIRLMFQDEAGFGRVNKPKRC